MVGMLPGVILYVYIGATASDISSAEGESSSSTKTIKTVFMVLGVIAGIAGVGFASWYAKNEIDGMSDEKGSRDSELGDMEKEEKGPINKV